MATAAVTNTFVAGTAAEAAEVNTNFTNLVTFLNNSVVHRDGSKAMTANFDAGSNKVVNLSAGTASTDAVNKTQLDLKADLASMPWGKIGVAKAPGTDQTGITTATDVTGLSLTWTADSSRSYKYTASLNLSKSGGAAGFCGVYITDASGTSIAGKSVYMASGEYAEVTVVWVETALSGSITRKVRADATFGGTTDIVNSSNRNAIFIVEDIGPT